MSLLDGPVGRCICLRETTVDGAPTGPVIAHPFCRATVHDAGVYDRRQAKVETSPYGQERAMHDTVTEFTAVQALALALADQGYGTTHGGYDASTVIDAFAENGWKVTPAVTDTDDRLLAAVLRRMLSGDADTEMRAVTATSLQIDTMVRIDAEEYAAIERVKQHGCDSHDTDQPYAIHPPRQA